MLAKSNLVSLKSSNRQSVKKFFNGSVKKSNKPDSTGKLTKSTSVSLKSLNKQTVKNLVKSLVKKSNKPESTETYELKTIADLRHEMAKVDDGSFSKLIAINPDELNGKTVSKKVSKKNSERIKKLMYSMNKKNSAKRNLYHYYYENPFKVYFRPDELGNFPKIFDEKLFSMIISLTLFQTMDQAQVERDIIPFMLLPLTWPNALIFQLFHKLYLFMKLPYAIYAKIKTYGMANKVEKLFKTVINDIYSNPKYEILQKAADSETPTNIEEPFSGHRNKKFTFEFVIKLAVLFIFFSLRKMKINDKTVGFYNNISTISLAEPIKIIDKYLLNVYNDSNKDDILTWFQDNYIFINQQINIFIPVLTKMQTVDAKQVLNANIKQNEFVNKIYMEELKKQGKSDEELKQIAYNPMMMNPGLINPLLMTNANAQVLGGTTSGVFSQDRNIQINNYDMLGNTQSHHFGQQHMGSHHHHH